MPNKIIPWVNDHSTEDAVRKILKQNSNLENIIEQLLDSRKEYGLKIQVLVEKLSEHLYG